MAAEAERSRMAAPNRPSAGQVLRKRMRCKSASSVAVTYKPPMLVPQVRLPAGAQCFFFNEHMGKLSSLFPFSLSWFFVFVFSAKNKNPKTNCKNNQLGKKGACHKRMCVSARSRGPMIHVSCHFLAAQHARP